VAIRHGQILHDADGYVIDRIQTGGVSSLNIPVERINEAGNYQTVATVRDIPDLTFEVQSLDVSPEMEAIALRMDPTASVEGTEFDFNKAIPIDVISPFKPGQGIFNIVAGIGIPYLTLENVTYRYGIKANAEQTFSFKGDSVFYFPGSPYYGQAVKSGTSYAFAHTALLYNDPVGNDVYAVGVCWHDPSTKLYSRLFHGQDYTDTNAGFTLTADALAAIPTGAILSWVYASATAANYPQSVHQGVSVKPAAVRGRNIDIYVAFGATPVMRRWTSVQSFEASRRVTLDANQEFGNSQYVSQDYDVPTVNGNLVFRPRDVADLLLKLSEIANVSSSEIIGALSSQPLQLEARIYDPTALTPTLLKTIYVPDARFTPPATQVRVGQKLEPTMPYESDSGTLLVYKGARP
jgi:hypothetical protein